MSEASHAFIEISSGSETEWTSASDWAETDDFDWVPAEYRCVDRIVSKRRRCGSSWLSSATSYFEPCDMWRMCWFPSLSFKKGTAMKWDLTLDDFCWVFHLFYGWMGNLNPFFEVGLFLLGLSPFLWVKRVLFFGRRNKTTQNHWKLEMPTFSE